MQRYVPDRKGPLNGLRLRIRLWQIASELDTEDTLLAVGDYGDLYPGQRLELPIATSAVRPLVPLKVTFEVLDGDGTRLKDAIVLCEYRQNQGTADGTPWQVSSGV